MNGESPKTETKGTPKQTLNNDYTLHKQFKYIQAVVGTCKNLTHKRVGTKIGQRVSPQGITTMLFKRLKT